ncbi:MAG TPA: DMT family transporter [Saprospiraceae bacterium]|nr:DMT family transporter [Saprospiraceae bacterium]
MSEVQASSTTRPEWQNWAVFVLLAFVWGGSFILIKKGLIHFSPVQVGAMRIALSAIAFLPIFLISKIPFPKGKVALVTLVVLTGNGVPAFLFALAETRLGSAVTGVLNSLTPIFALLMGVFFFGTKLRRHHLVGLFLGCLGITVLVLGEEDWRVSSYVFFVVIGTLCYGISANLVKRYCQDIHPIALTAVGFFPLGCISIIILWLTGAGPVMAQAETWETSMPSLIILSLVCTVFANILFYHLIQRTSAIFGSAIAYAIPCMALVWGSVDGEKITWYQFAGFAFIVGAVYTLRRK